MTAIKLILPVFLAVENGPFPWAWQIMNCIILHNFGFGTWIFSSVSAIVESFWILLSVVTFDLQMPLIENRNTTQSHWNLLSKLCLGRNSSGSEWTVFSLSAENCAPLDYGCLNKGWVRRKSFFLTILLVFIFSRGNGIFLLAHPQFLFCYPPLLKIYWTFGNMGKEWWRDVLYSSPHMSRHGVIIAGWGAE